MISRAILRQLRAAAKEAGDLVTACLVDRAIDYDDDVARAECVTLAWKYFCDDDSDPLGLAETQ